MQELKDEQYNLNAELDSFTNADYQYHIHVSTVLDLSSRMSDIFESSEIEEKRTILDYLLQNPTVEGREFNFTLKKPFNLVLSLAEAQRKNRVLNPASSIWRG